VSINLQVAIVILLMIIAFYLTYRFVWKETLPGTSGKKGK